MSAKWSEIAKKPSKQQQQQQQKSHTHSKKVVNDRFLFTILSLIGQQVNVHLKDGAVVEGLFHSTSDPKRGFEKFRIDLPLVRSVSKRFNKKGRLQGKNSVVFGLDDITHVVARKVSKREDGFETDSKIGRIAAETEKKNMKSLWNRELERCNGNWVSNVKDEELPDESEKTTPSGQKWDQFKHFKPLKAGTGVKNFDAAFEKIYSTPLDMSIVKKEQMEFAKRKAEEIASKKTDNVHLAEERGQETHKNMSSEDRYSGVLRTTASNDEKKTSKEEKNPSSSSSSAGGGGGGGEKTTTTTTKPKKPVKSKLSAESAEWVPSFNITPRPQVPPAFVPQMMSHQMYMPHQFVRPPPHPQMFVPHHGGMMMPPTSQQQYPRGRPR